MLQTLEKTKWFEDLLRLVSAFEDAKSRTNQKMLEDASEEQNALVKHIMECPFVTSLQKAVDDLNKQLSNTRAKLEKSRRHESVLMQEQDNLQRVARERERLGRENQDLNERLTRALRELHDLGRDPETSSVVDGRPQHTEVVALLKRLMGEIRNVSREILRVPRSASTAWKSDNTKAETWRIMGEVSSILSELLSELRSHADSDQSADALIAERMANKVAECVASPRETWPTSLNEAVQHACRDCATTLAKILEAQPPAKFLTSERGESFDASRHEVVAGMKESGMVTATVFPGYVVSYSQTRTPRILLKAVVTTIGEV